jgi:hypothetical protein
VRVCPCTVASLVPSHTTDSHSVSIGSITNCSIRHDSHGGCVSYSPSSSLASPSAFMPIQSRWNDTATTLCAVVACTSTAAGLDVVFASSQQSIANAMTQTPLTSHSETPTAELCHRSLSSLPSSHTPLHPAFVASHNVCKGMCIICAVPHQPHALLTMSSY